MPQGGGMQWGGGTRWGGGASNRVGWHMRVQVVCGSGGGRAARDGAVAREGVGGK